MSLRHTVPIRRVKQGKPDENGFFGIPPAHLTLATPLWPCCAGRTSNVNPWNQLKTAAVLPDGTGPNIVAEDVRRVFLPKTPETFVHDDDGNLTAEYAYGPFGEALRVTLTRLEDTEFAARKCWRILSYESSHHIGSDGLPFCERVFRWEKRGYNSAPRFGFLPGGKKN